MNLSLVDKQLLRARLYIIKRLIPLFPDLKKFLQNGVVPPGCKEDFESLKNEAFDYQDKNNIDASEPLTFVELCSFCTWFEIYPEKIAGKQVLKTSRAFPVSIKGTKEDIINTIEKGIKKDADKMKRGTISSTASTEERIRIAGVKALAKLKLLKLLKL